MKITLRTFPTPEGDTTTVIDESDLEKIFTDDMTIAYGDKTYSSWDKLLEDIHESGEENPEVLRFRKVIGG